MFAILAIILFLGANFERVGGGSSIPAWFDWRGVTLLGLACLAAHLFWPTLGRKP